MTHDKNAEDGWIQTYTGRKFSLINPSPDDVCIADIAHALSNLCRFVGHTKRFYSVAQHCCLVYDIILRRKHESEIKKQALLHDASEAYLCDIPAPLKLMLPDYQEIETKVTMVIFERFGLRYNYYQYCNEMVLLADRVALGLEAEDKMLFDSVVDGWSNELPRAVFSVPYVNWSINESEKEFLKRCVAESIDGAEQALADII